MERLTYVGIQKGLEMAAEFLLSAPAHVSREDIAHALKTAKLSVFSVSAEQEESDVGE